MHLVVVFLVINTLSCSFAAQTSEADDESTLPLMPSGSKRVVGGEAAVPHSYPFIAGIEIMRTHMCGGSIIDPQWILTAAHCVANNTFEIRLLNGSNVTLPMMPYLVVVVGDHSKSRNHPHEVRARVDNIVLHPNYSSGGKDSDVALLRLSTPLNYNGHVLPIKLAKTDPELNRTCVVAGWGLTNAKKNDMSTFLKFASVSVLNSEICRKLHKMYKKELSENMFCAGRLEGGSDTCTGDSGGPLFCTEQMGNNPFPTQYGVTNWGPPKCARRNRMGVYARLSKFIPWIELVTGVQV